jgi:hypothetical protein
MENTIGTGSKPRERLVPNMTWKHLAILLARCIAFLWAAGYALVDGTDTVNFPRQKTIVERRRKDAEIRQIVAANIAKGDPIPRRETMLEELDAHDGRTLAVENLLVISGQSMRRVGLYVLVGIAVQFYVVFRLRAHYWNLQREASASPGE